jgi:DNA-binding NarL/FixJ family response regulator
MLASRPVPIAAAPVRRAVPSPVRLSVHLPAVVGAGLLRLLGPHAERVEVLHRVDGDRAQVDVFDPDLAVPVPRCVPRVALTRDRSARTSARARELGAVRVLPLDVTVPDLVRTLEQVHAAARAEREHGRLDSASSLSPREIDVVAGICRGLSNGEIAAELFISVNSVKTYIRTAYRKMGVVSRSQAVLWGIQHGL